MESEFTNEMNLKYQDLSIKEINQAMYELKLQLQNNNEIITTINTQIATNTSNVDNKDWLISALNKKKYVRLNNIKIEKEFSYLRQLKYQNNPNNNIRNSKQYLVLGYQYTKMKEFIINEYGIEKFSKIVNIPSNNDLYELYNLILKNSK